MIINLRPVLLILLTLLCTICTENAFSESIPSDSQSINKCDDAENCKSNETEFNFGIPELNFTTLIPTDVEINYSHDVYSLFKKDFDELFIGHIRSNVDNALFDIKVFVFRFDFPAYAPAVCPIVFGQIKFNLDKTQSHKDTFFRSDLTGYDPEPGQKNHVRVVCASRGRFVIAFVGRYVSVQNDGLVSRQQEVDTFFDKMKFDQKIDDFSQFNSSYFQIKTFEYNGRKLILHFPPKWAVIDRPILSDVPFLKGKSNALTYGAGLQLMDQKGDEKNIYGMIGIFIYNKETKISIFQDYIQEKIREISNLWHSGPSDLIWMSSFSDGRLDKMRITNEGVLYRHLFPTGGDISRTMLFFAQDMSTDYIISSYAAEYYGFFQDAAYQYGYISSQTAEQLIIHDLRNYIMDKHKEK